MPALRRFAPLLAIVAFLVLVAVGGAALTNNNQTPDVDPRTATVSVGGDGENRSAQPEADEKPTASPTSEEPMAEEPAPIPEPTSAPAPAPAPPPPPQPRYHAPAPSPQAPLNYQYYDDDWDEDDRDDDWDDDWDDDDWDD